MNGGKLLLFGGGIKGKSPARGFFGSRVSTVWMAREFARQRSWWFKKRGSRMTTSSCSGNKAAYLKNRGLDKEHCKELIKLQLREFGPSPRNEIDAFFSLFFPSRHWDPCAAERANPPVHHASSNPAPPPTARVPESREDSRERPVSARPPHHGLSGEN